jgi:hypothetical protein
MRRVQLSKEQQLKRIDFGQIAAEDDDALVGYFIETPIFEQILENRRDFIIGRKGAGKTAIFLTLAEKQGMFEQINEKLIIPINTPNTMLESPYLRENIKLQEHNYRVLWKIFISFYVAKFLIESPLSSVMDFSEMKSVLKGTGVEEEMLGKKPIGAWLRTLLSLPNISVIYEGVEYKMGVNTSKLEGKRQLNLSNLLRAQSNVLTKHTREAWVLLDRLDEIAPSNETSHDFRTKALVALMNAYSDLRLFKGLKLKIFLRKDIYDDLAFENKDQFSDRKTEIVWEPAHLKRLVAKRIQVSVLREQNQKAYGSFTDQDADKYFNVAFDKQIHYNGIEADTFSWIFENLRDGNDFVSPRDMLNLCSKAKERQLDYIMRSINDPESGLMSSAAILAAYKDSCKDKLNDYLYGVFRHVRDSVENFRGIHKKTITMNLIKEILRISKDEDAYLIVDELCKIGFLKKTGGKPISPAMHFDIPPIYATALEIAT